MPGFLFITVIIYLRRFFNRTPHAVSLRSAPSQLQSIMGIVRGFPHSIKNIYIYTCSFPRSIEGNMCVHSTYLARFVTRLKVETKWHFNMPHEAVEFSLINIVKVPLFNLEDALEWAIQIQSGRAYTQLCPTVQWSASGIIIGVISF